MRYVLVFDTETTGLTSEDTVCQLAAAKLDAETLVVIDTFESLIDPQRPINAGATKIHGITDADVAGQPLLSDVMASGFSSWLRRADYWSGHNLQFDIRMLKDHIAHPYPTVLDTYFLSRSRFKRWSNHRLQTAVKELGLDGGKAHDALSDVLACAQLLRVIADGRPVSELCADYNSYVHRNKAAAMQLLQR